MFEIPLLLILIVLVALVFDFTNGAHDCANAIATVVSTKVVTPRFAVGMAAALNLAGALLGTEVAKTLGAGLVLPEVVQGSHILVLAALLGAIFWNCLTWYFGIPSSSSHALIGGLVGAALAHAGPDALNFAGIVNKVLLPLVLCLAGCWWAVEHWGWPEWLFLPAVGLGLAAGAQNFWVFCKERLERSKHEKNHRVGFNSHQ